MSPRHPVSPPGIRGAHHRAWLLHGLRDSELGPRACRAIAPACSLVLKVPLHLVVLAMEGEAWLLFLQLVRWWSVLGCAAVTVTVVYLLSHSEYINPISSSHITYQ